MGFKNVTCSKCGANLKIDDDQSEVACRYCGAELGGGSSAGTTATPHLELAKGAASRGEYGRAMQHIEDGLAIDPSHSGLLSLQQKTSEQLRSFQGIPGAEVPALDLNRDAFHEAEQYKLQAEFILHQLQANVQVYGSNSAFTGAQPADVELALKYINRSLEHFPDNPAYLNLKALFLMEGKNDREGGLKLLERAAQLAPNDITIQDNLEKSKSSSSSCFIATAAYGSPLAPQVDSLRAWRDNSLLKSSSGRLFVRTYYRISPPLARFIAKRESRRALARLALRPLVSRLPDQDR